MKRITSAIAIVAILASTTVGFAQAPEVGVQNADTTSEASNLKTKEIDFNKGDNIEGATNKGGGTLFKGERHDKIASLITVRTSFVTEMMKSVEDL